MKLILSLILAAVALAQTGVKPQQLAAIPASNFRIFVFNANGGATLAQTDSSLTLDNSTTPPTLRAMAAASVREMVEVTKTSLPQTAFPMGQVPISAPLVTDNGLVLAIGEDYTFVAGSKTITLLRAAEAGDIVQIRYRW